MLEARLREAGVLKKIIEALRDLVTDFSFEFTDEGLKMQAMDSSHVSLCVLAIERDAFDAFRCDKPTPLGLSLPALSKVLKCANNDDTVTLSCGDSADRLNLLFENKAQDKLMEFSVKLMELDEEALGIPEQEYSSKVTMPSGEFAKVIRDLAQLGDTVSISCSKDGVRFTVNGDVGTANVTIRSSSTMSASIDDDNENAKANVTTVEVADPVELTFALRYLKLFTQACPLSSRVRFSLASDIPLLLEFVIDNTSAPGGSGNKDSSSKPKKKSKKAKDSNIKEEDEEEADNEVEMSYGSSERMGTMQFYLAPKIDEDMNTPSA